MPIPHWQYRAAKNRRLDPAAYAEAGRPVFFTVRAAEGTSPFANATLARIMEDCLLGQQEKSRCRLITYCVMPNHLHFVVAPVEEGASTLTYVDRLKGWSSCCLHLAGWEGNVWQPRSYDHVVRVADDLEQIVAYVLQNPVRAGLCATVEEYPWCGVVEQDDAGL